MLIGTGLYSVFYDQLNRWLLHLGEFGDVTLPDLLKAPTWLVILVSVALIGLFLLLLELVGL